MSCSSRMDLLNNNVAFVPLPIVPYGCCCSWQRPAGCFWMLGKTARQTKRRLWLPCWHQPEVIPMTQRARLTGRSMEEDCQERHPLILEHRHGTTTTTTTSTTRRNSTTTDSTATTSTITSNGHLDDRHKLHHPHRLQHNGYIHVHYQHIIGQHDIRNVRAAMTVTSTCTSTMDDVRRWCQLDDES